ncbi:hypothetical protein N7535_008569 [Penicillium sp. DV-2018c]|nr:hypothetical protein N7535_008569 [Penicillium sp. DV-2018c]
MASNANIDIAHYAGRKALMGYIAKTPSTCFLDNIKDVSYFRWLQRYNHNTGRPRRAQDIILSYWREYNPDTHPEGYARVRLMLHHPFRAETDLFSFEWHTFASFASAFAYCRRVRRDHDNDHYGSEDVPDVPEDLYEDADHLEDEASMAS